MYVKRFAKNHDYQFSLVFSNFEMTSDFIKVHLYAVANPISGSLFMGFIRYNIDINEMQ